MARRVWFPWGEMDSQVVKRKEVVVGFVRVRLDVRCSSFERTFFAEFHARAKDFLISLIIAAHKFLGHSRTEQQ